MAAYYQVDVVLNSQAVTVGLPSPQSVSVTLPLVGPQGSQGPQGEQGPPGEVSGSIAWANVTDKPATFTPSAHTHAIADVTGLQAALDAAGNVDSVNGQTGAVVLTAADLDAAEANHGHNFSDINVNGVQISGAGDGNANGPYLFSGDFGDRGAYHKDKNSLIYWDGSAWLININGEDKYSSAQNVSFPYQITSWTVIPGNGTAPAPTSNARLSGQEFEEIVGIRINPTARGSAAEKDAPTSGNASSTQVVLGSDTRLTDSRTPLAHKASHATGGTDALAPSDIGAQSLFVTTTNTISGNTTISAGRALIYQVATVSAVTADISLPSSGHADGDVIVVRSVTPFAAGTTLTIKSGTGATLDTITASNQAFRYTANSNSPNAWSKVLVDTHTHTDATTTVAGFLSTADKTKLDGIASGAEVNVNADWNASSGDAQILNKPLLGTASSRDIDAISDSDLRIADNADATKKVAFECSGITSGQTRVLTVPDASGKLGWLQSVSSITVSTDHQLTASRNQRVLVTSTNIASGAVVFLPASSNAEGDRLEVVCVGLTSGALTVRTGPFDFTISVAMGLNTQRTFIYTAGAWTVGTVERHTHNFSDITGSLSISDSSLRVINGTKQLAFDVSAVGIGSLRTLTVPNASGTIALTSDIPAAGIGGSTGATDNALLRADGSGGSAAQASDLIVDDTIVAYAITGDASTDVITAVGHNFTNNQAVRFQVLTGGSGLSNAATYFVRDISGNTLKVSTSSGPGAAVNFTTNITAGSIVAVQRGVSLRAQRASFAITADAATDTITATGHTFIDGDAVMFSDLTGGTGLDTVTRYFVTNSAANTFKVQLTAGGATVNVSADYTGGTVDLEVPIVISGTRNGAFIVGNRPDGTSIGGNPRGGGAVDFQQNRNSATAVASGNHSFIAAGTNNTASGTQSIVCGGSGNTASGFQSAVLGGRSNTANNDRSIAGGDGNTSSSTNTVAFGSGNTASAAQCVALGSNSRADRQSLIAHAAGAFATAGDAQRIHAVLRCTTTTNAAVEMALDGGTTYLTIPSGKVMYGEIYVVGVRAGGADVAIYRAVYAAKNIGGTSTEVFSSVTTDAATGTSLEIATVDAGDYIRVRPTGVASQNWRWVAKADLVEVGHG